MIRSQSQPTENVRLIYRELVGWPLYWESYLARLRQYVEKSPALNLAGGRVHFVFYDLPGKVALEDMDSALAIEVLGHEFFSPESEYQLLDLDRGEYYGLERPINFDELAHSEIFLLAQDAARKWAGKGVLLAPTWRLLWDMGHAPRYIDIQFFPEL